MLHFHHWWKAAVSIRARLLYPEMRLFFQGNLSIWCCIESAVLTLTWPMCQIWHILFLQILNAPADCMLKQNL